MLEFKSVTNGAILRFSVIDRSNDGTDFYVEIQNHFGSAKTKSSTYLNGSPAVMFEALAKEWRGWNGEKSWSDLERNLELSARSDSTGHTTLAVSLTDYESSFKTVLVFEAGQLERMANEIAELLP